MIDSVTWISLAFSLLLMLEKVWLRTKKCKSTCCCMSIEQENVESIDLEKKPETVEEQTKEQTQN
jgi:hypothetical protein